jgi:hypothetical protein
MSKRQSNRTIVSPFQGEPYTISTKDEYGNLAMLVRISEITLEGASRADNLSGFCGFIVFVFLFLVGAGSGNFWSGWPVYLHHSMPIQKFSKVFTPR